MLFSLGEQNRNKDAVELSDDPHYETINDHQSEAPEYDDVMVPAPPVPAEPCDPFADAFHQYDNAMNPIPAVYDQPYAVVASADPGGFVALGSGTVTHYNTEENNFEKYDPASNKPSGSVVLGKGSVTQYNMDEDGDMKYQPAAAIGHPDVVVYQKADDASFQDM